MSRNSLSCFVSLAIQRGVQQVIGIALTYGQTGSRAKSNQTRTSKIVRRTKRHPRKEHIICCFVMALLCWHKTGTRRRGTMPSRHSHTMTTRHPTTSRNMEKSAALLVSLLALLASTQSCDAFTAVKRTATRVPSTVPSTSALSVSTSPEEAMERTMKQLERMKRTPQAPQDEPSNDPEYEELYQSYIKQPANALKAELKKRKLRVSGRKPDLANRLTQHDLGVSDAKNAVEEVTPWDVDSEQSQKRMASFCGLRLSKAAGVALGNADFQTPTTIQADSLPRLVEGESLVLHAETGSGKTLAYLLPITEQLWLDHENDNMDDAYAFILTPTRELAAQVAGIASVLAPPGTVRMVSQPTDLMSSGDALRDRGEQEHGGLLDDDSPGRARETRLYIGSAKAIMTSLYGNEKMPASPTRKPQAMFLLQHVRWLVLDEVDRLLNVKKSRGYGPSSPAGKAHERPAAIVTAAVARMTLGRAQIIAASATVGRPMKRELTRVLGLTPQECPDIIHGTQAGDDVIPSQQGAQRGVHQSRAITIPATVKNYVTAIETTTSGQLLTSAFFVVKGLNLKKGRKMLLVLTRGCGLSTQNAIGALKHFRCEPSPTSLLDALQADGTDRMIEKHRLVSGATGIGESSYFQKKKASDSEDGAEDESEDGYLLVTGEDTVRGLHLDGLDVVIVVGRAPGPDEYMHIAGRTGRAGRRGMVINVLSKEDTAAVKGWEKMLDTEFEELEVRDVAKLD